jgi:hypothetical protein
MRVITDSWVMMRREPQRYNGQVIISRSKIRPSNLAQFQYGVPVFDASLSTPYCAG